MLKALLKKQLMEINQFYFRNKKTGKRKSRGSTIASIVLLAFLFLVLALAFYGLSATLGGAFVDPNGQGELEWLYFALMGLMAFLLAVVGSAFQTYSSLYQAKDNELLLSMPIKPAYILFSRMMGVVLTGLLYSSLVWLPCVVYYGIVKGGLSFLLPLLQLPAIVAFATTVTCALGWLIALVASRLKNKSVITALISVLFFGAYLLLVNRFSDLVQRIILTSGEVAKAIKTWMFPMYLLGNGSVGNVSGLLGFWALSFGLLALCVWILSRSFTKIVTTNQGQKASKRKSGSSKPLSRDAALLRREWRHFVSSATYMLNTGFGIILMVLLAAVALVKQKELYGLVTVGYLMFPELKDLLPIVLFVMMAFLLSMNAISAPSISLEGKTMPIIRSLPVSTRSVLKAKKMLHILLNFPAAMLCVSLVCVAMKLPFYTPVGLAVPIALYLWFFANLGLILNLKHVNLNWTNETVPVKQGMSVMLSMFGGWAIAIVIGVVAFLVRKILSGWLFLLAASALLGLLILLEEKWLSGKGARLFESL